MYKQPASSELLQGDVISELSYPVFSDVTLPVSGRTGRQEFRAHVTVKTGFVAVVSHSCDLVVYGAGPKRPAFLFCPLIPVPENIRRNAERYALLRENRIDPARPHYVNLFWYIQHQPLEQDMVMDFSTIQPLPIT